MPRFTFERLAMYLVILGVASAACLMPAQSDTFWQVRAGREMVASGRVLLQDTFTHTVPGAYWPNHEWLSHVLFYLLHAVGGLPLLTAFGATIVTVSWWCVWRLMQGPPALRLALVLCLVAPSARLWSLRPQLLSLLFLCLTCVLLQSGRRRWIPLLFVVWANFHGGVMVGVAALGGALAATVLRDRTEWKVAAVTLGASLVAVCLTPLGVSVWTEVPRMLERLNAYGVSEWQPASLTDPLDFPFWVAAVVLIALTARHWRALDRDGAALIGSALALVPLAVESSRNIAPFLICVGPALSRLLPLAVTWMPQRTRRERSAVNLGLAATFSALSIAGIVFAWTKPLDRLNWTPVSGHVVQAVSACPGNLYNLYDNGGYLVWFVPARPVFIDSRQDPFPVELVSAQIAAERTGKYEQLFARYDIQCAALPPESRVAARLAKAGWRVTSADARWLVLLREPPDIPGVQAASPVR